MKFENFTIISSLVVIAVLTKHSIQYQIEELSLALLVSFSLGLVLTVFKLVTEYKENKLQTIEKQLNLKVYIANNSMTIYEDENTNNKYVKINNKFHFFYDNTITNLIVLEDNVNII